VKFGTRKSQICRETETESNGSTIDSRAALE